MSARMKNPALLLPGTIESIQSLMKATTKAGVPQSTLDLVHLRASQINGCGFCVDSGVKSAGRSGVTGEQLGSVAAWRETPYFSDAERAALELTEYATRLADRPEAVPDPVWDEAAKHYDEQGLAAIVMMIGLTNLFNRLNATTRQQAGVWG